MPAAQVQGGGHHSLRSAGHEDKLHITSRAAAHILECQMRELSFPKHRSSSSFRNMQTTRYALVGLDRSAWGFPNARSSAHLAGPALETTEQRCEAGAEDEVNGANEDPDFEHAACRHADLIGLESQFRH